MPVRQVIVRAYGVQAFQILGGPSWITGDRFDITAKAADDGATPAQLNLMLQSLLADRFKLKTHKEMRQSDVYHLVKARPDGKLDLHISGNYPLAPANKPPVPVLE